MPKTFDPKCYDLAKQFLSDQETESQSVFEKQCQSLAWAIQDAIDEWFATERQA